MKKHIISVLVENEFGVLTRVAALFSGRGYNIQSLTVAETIDSKVSRMTLTTNASTEVLEQIIKQLNKLINVIKVEDVTGDDTINLILGLIKVKLTPKQRFEVIKTAEVINAKVIDADDKSCIIEMRGNESEIKSHIALFKPYGILEFTQTGIISIERGSETFNPNKKKKK
jgi:acetolactate synthase-1/3 small subunit